MEVQTRDIDGEIIQHPSFTEAFEYAISHDLVWKISWTDSNDRRIRMVRASFDLNIPVWAYEPLVLPEPKKRGLHVIKD